MNQRKLLKELNLLDKFLFDEAMDDPENVKTMLDIILLNTRGKHPELVSPELIELLKYMERSTDEVSGECKSKGFKRCIDEFVRSKQVKRQR